MAITSKGYERALTYAELGTLLSHAGAQYSVFGVDSFRCGINFGGSDRSVRVLPGRAYGAGIVDDSSDAVILTGAPVGSGDRWDMVVLRRNWTAKTTALVLVSGSSTKVLPDRSMNPGVEDDQPIALVRFSAGQTQAVEVVDLRVWHGDGGCTARDRLVLNYLDRIGSRIYLLDRTYVYAMQADGNPKWVTDSVVVSTAAPSPADVPWLQIPA